MPISDDDYRKGRVRVFEVAAQIKRDTGVEVRINPKAKPFYLVEFLLGTHIGRKKLSLYDIKFCLLREFLPFPEGITVRILENDDETTTCRVIIKKSSYEALVATIKDFFRCPEGKISTADALKNSFTKFCNLKNKPLVVLEAQASFFLTKRKF